MCVCIHVCMYASKKVKTCKGMRVSELVGSFIVRNSVSSTNWLVRDY